MNHAPAPKPADKSSDASFLPVVISFVVAILVVLAISVYVLHRRGTRMVPHGPNPAPNSLLMPPHPVPSSIRLG